MAEKDSQLLRRCCFFDRDGVVNVEVDYLHEAEKTVLETGFVEAVKLAHERDFLVIVVTNQAGVARGKYPEEDIAKVHNRIQELLAEYGEKVDAFYYCPHHPEYSGFCECRKPEPGMLLKAAREWNIDLSNSLMIGDRLSDVGAGRNAGCKAAYLVRTGYGEKVLEKNPSPGCPVAKNSYEALKDFLLNEHSKDLPLAEKIWQTIRNFFLPRLNRWFFLRLIIVALAAYLIFSYLLIPCVISGPSMEPTVPSKGFTFCWRGSYWFKKPSLGDIVIIKYDRGIYLLKRIVALPGDTVEFRNGKLVVNDEVIDESYVVYPCVWDMPPKKVATDEFYVVGDNRSMPLHLHMQGAVKAYRIIGQPAFL